MFLSMKNLLAALLLFFSLAMSSGIATADIQLKRGVALEAWVTWPGDERLSEPGLVQGFPEWRGSISDAQLRDIRSAGFDFVRMPIDPAMYLWPANRDKWDKLSAGVKEAIRRLSAADLKVIVDLHAMPAFEGWKSMGSQTYVGGEQAFSDYLKLVDHMGRAIAGEDPSRVLFEPMNEPVIDCDSVSGKNARWPRMLAQMHETARKAAPAIPIILSGGCWGGALGLSAIDSRTIQDANVMWSFHSYEPFIFTHQAATWTDGPESFVSGLDYPPNRKQWRSVLAAADNRIAKSKHNKSEKAKLKKELRYNLQKYFRAPRKELDQDFALVKRWAKKNNIAPNRILLGEFGSHRVGVSDASRARYLHDTRVKAEKAGYPWAAWTWRGTFGLGITETATEISPLVRSSLGLK
jgi:aryl-phospho-beta-D-glucosidase BglC (GH1 family)